MDQTENGKVLPQAENNRGKDRLLVFVSMVMGFLLFDFILFEGFGISTTVYVLLFYTAAFWYLSGRQGGIQKSGLWLLAPIALLASCFTLYSNFVLALCNSLLLMALVTLQLATMTGSRLYRSFSLGYVIDLFHTAVALPIVNVPAPFQALKRNTGERKQSLAPVIIGLAVSLPILLVVLSLLASADAVFERTLKSALSFIENNLLKYLLEILFGTVMAVLFFSLMSALRGGRVIQGMKRKINYTRVRFINEGVLDTVFVLLNAVYLIFIAVQFGYLFNAFSNILPSGFNHASYARRGFFELMGISAINLGMLGGSYLFSRRSGRMSTRFLKGMETSLVVLTLLLIVSAFSKMAFYMQTYGLTLLRVYTSWFMLLLAVIFIAVLVKLYVPRFALSRFCAGTFVILYLALNFLNADALVPRYNIRLYQSGAVRSVDITTFYDLSDSAVPYATELLEGGGAAAADAREFLESRAGVLDDTRWKTFTVDRMNAQSAIRAKGIR